MDNIIEKEVQEEWKDLKEYIYNEDKQLRQFYCNTCGSSSKIITDIKKLLSEEKQKGKIIYLMAEQILHSDQTGEEWETKDFIYNMNEKEQINHIIKYFKNEVIARIL